MVPVVGVTITVSPATIFDMADMCEGLGRLYWGITKQAWLHGETFALKAGDQLIAIAGLYPLDGPGEAEGWFKFSPAARAHTIGITRAIRLTLSTSPYSAIVTLCATRQGARLARAAGFVFQADSELGEVWAYGLSQRRRRRPRQEGSREATAA